MTDTLLPFPTHPAPPPAAPHGLTLRAATVDDLPFLAEIHAASRAAELAFMPWPDAQKRAFLDQQFDLQHRYLMQTRPRADYWVIERDGTAIGRFYVDRDARLWQLVDIALAPDAQGGGTGSALVGWLQDLARAAGAGGIVLHVAMANPRAQTLYRRLGFTEMEEGDGIQVPMIWTP